MKYVTLVTAIFVALMILSSNYHNTGGGKLTGALTYEPPERESNTFAYLLRDWVNGFFQVRGVVFPEGSCTSFIRQIFDEITNGPISVTEDFSTYGPERVSNIVWGIEQEHAGALEMVYGKDLLKDYGVDSSLHLYAESVVRIPRVDRASVIDMNLFGYAEDYFYVTHGEIIMPSLTCKFSSQNGIADCKCEYIRSSEYRY